MLSGEDICGIRLAWHPLYPQAASDACTHRVESRREVLDILGLARPFSQRPTYALVIDEEDHILALEVLPEGEQETCGSNELKRDDLRMPGVQVEEDVDRGKN